MIFRILAAVVGTFGFALLFALGERMQRPLARLVRGVLLVLTSLLALVGLLIGVTGAANEAWWAVAIGGLVLLLAARLGWKVKRLAAERARASRWGPGVPSTSLLPDLRWRKLDGVLSWPERQRARLAREHIQGFLAERESPSLTTDHQALLVSLERRVPELIDTCLDRCRRARPEERRTYVAVTLDKLTQIGTEAERARQEVRAADDTRLEVLHRYFDTVAPASGQRPADR